jgi:NAD(P)-dependent dehydrogenase (short-subunit alcohol dehydrogenase family)
MARWKHGALVGVEGHLQIERGGVGGSRMGDAPYRGSQEMRIMLIGASGTIGKAILDLLSPDHEVVGVGNTSGDYRVDLAAKATIEQLFQEVGKVDAVISAAGQARFAPFDKLSDEDYAVSLSNKLMGQVNLVRVGFHFVADAGSFTLTSGVLASRPIPGSAAISLVNAGLEGFARAAAIELPRGIRINVVSPPWVSETLQAMSMDPTAGMPAARVALAYKESAESRRTGDVIEAATFA